ncbi:DUF4434 domain-containing protein [Nonomuraea phyllanthi]|uniref:DUF4434 domain-containing protein n=1 Tax=Nonomuraea phyllanthi TaxID=2219224 RepID=A0A5C4VWY3_9ACTN|nr:DUF4434 domain-containing protein [Nonomuraea phyllanthi]KAB8190268.1 DUF4434 domain-containing protein [Nonomuraea phyllanthi]QFY05510.1 DUF4434 domain-containing protein [Nonomuraea phyllanthi]
MRWLLVVAGLAVLAVVATVIIILPSSSDDPPTAASATPTPSETEPTPNVSKFTDPCGTFETKEVAPYAVTGYWITPKSNPCTWRKQLKEIHDVGGDTIIRIGYGLQFRTVSDSGEVLTRDGELDSLYKGCVEDGLSCHDAAERDLRELNPRNRVGRTYVYRTDESFGPKLFRCPEVEHAIKVGKRVYFRLITQVDGSDDATCDFSSKPQAYDMILVAGAETDSLSELLRLGDQFGMRIFPALPLAPRDPKTPTRAYKKHLGALTTLTRRILQDYGVRFADRASLGGVYQPFEVQMSASLSRNPTLEVYADQHTIVDQELPGKPILISPYLDARKRKAFGQTPRQVAEAFEALAKTGVGIIAPQDSRGTGKVGLFWPDERDDEVDPRLRPVVGESTYGTAYHGSTRDYYREMATARQEMVDAGYQVDLWANVEAFEPSGEEPCAPQGTRGKTDKERLDQAVTMAGRYVQKVVSYMWSDFMTCGQPSLEEEITADWRRPIAVDAIRRPRDVQDGVEVRGYNLTGSTVTITWSGGTNDQVVAAVGWLDPAPPGDLPEGMMAAWVPFDWTQVPAGEWVRITVKGATGEAATEPLHVRILM